MRVDLQKEEDEEAQDGGLQPARAAVRMDEEAEETVAPAHPMGCGGRSETGGGHGGRPTGGCSCPRAAEALHPSVGVGGRGQTLEGGGGTIGGSIGSDRRGCINKVFDEIYEKLSLFYVYIT